MRRSGGPVVSHSPFSRSIRNYFFISQSDFCGKFLYLFLIFGVMSFPAYIDFRVCIFHWIHANVDGRLRYHRLGLEVIQSIKKCLEECFGGGGFRLFPFGDRDPRRSCQFASQRQPYGRIDQGQCSKRISGEIHS